MDDRLTAERDLYRGLFALAGAEDPRPLLEAALARVVEAVGARQGYLAIGFEGDAARFVRAHDAARDEARAADEARAVLSRGIVREALARGETVSTAAAHADPRFAGRGSVVAGRLQAVMCAPIGGVGVIYVAERASPGPFGADDQRLLEDFARAVAPWAGRLAAAPPEADPTAPWRAQLRGAEGLAGRSNALAELLRGVALVAPLDVTVLLLGPSGAGKTELARTIHLSSPRARGPFVELNCAALPEALVESELFGAEKGAHSAADRRVEGKVEAAAGGTLLLDEIGELPLASQAKLLQFLQSRRYYRLGGNKPLEADVRVVAATNVDLEAAVAARTFREDLYWRLAVLPLRVPALDERRGDIGIVAEALLERAVRRHRLPTARLSPAALAALGAAEWPGNVRQLTNVVEAGLIRAQGAGTVEPRHLYPGVEGAEEAATFAGATRAFQRRLLAETLTDTGWNVAETARRLDLARSHLHELLRGFGLRRPG
ncbi:MAG: sigma-54-dependent Fis family transcriptional regulator [Pseudomonadota bacterium]|nr:sigma-54-dependent Fis family transcriptional regulator [Pseudomonadota bacterium]